MGFNLNNFGSGVSAASGLFGIFDNIFGFGRKRNIRDNQEMMRYSAGLGEGQAKRDYARTLDMFGKQSDFSREMFETEMDFNEDMLEDQQEYNSAVAQKQRLKDAGLSVGLMMGGGGAGASTSASTSAPNAPGGSPAPSGRPAPMSLSDKLYGALTLDSMKTAIEGQRLDNESKKVAIEKARADADIKKTNEETNLLEIQGLHLGETMLSNIAINRESANLNKLRNKEVEANVAKITAETILPYIQKDLADFKMGKEFNLTEQMTKAIIENVNSEAKKNNWSIGEFTNWKTWTELGTEVGKAVVNGVVGGGIAKGLMKKGGTIVKGFGR